MPSSGMKWPQDRLQRIKPIRIKRERFRADIGWFFHRESKKSDK
jgi:hypothetical protein